MDWSDESDAFFKVIESLCLPCFVKVDQNVSDENRLETFSSNDVLSLHRIIPMKQVCMQKLDLETLALSDNLFIPLDYDGFFKIIILDPDMEYRILKEMLNPPPRFVHVNKDFKSPTGVRFLRNTTFEIISVDRQKQGCDTKVSVRYNDKKIHLPDFTVGSFTALEDQTVFILKDIVSKNIIPQFVKPVDDKITNYTTLLDNEVFQITGVAERQVAVGDNICQKRVFMLPLQSNIMIHQMKEKDTTVNPVPKPPVPARRARTQHTPSPNIKDAKPSAEISCSPKKRTDNPVQKQEQTTHSPGLHLPINRPMMQLPNVNRMKLAPSFKNTDAKPSTEIVCGPKNSNKKKKIDATKRKEVTHAMKDMEDNNVKLKGKKQVGAVDLTADIGTSDDLYDYLDLTKMGVFADTHPLVKPVGLVSPVRQTESEKSPSTDEIQNFSISKLYHELQKCGLNSFAVVCQKEKVDGELFCGLTDEDLSGSPFNLTTFEILKCSRMKTGWRPKQDR